MNEKMPIACVPLPQMPIAAAPPIPEPSRPIVTVNQTGIGSGPRTARRARPPVMKPKSRIMSTDPSIEPSLRPGRRSVSYPHATRSRFLIVSGAGALLLGAVFASAGGARQSIVWFAGNDAPVWSPDGSLIAFTAFRGGHPGEIYVMRPNGTGQRDLTRNPAYDDLAAWSPDAKK